MEKQEGLKWRLVGKGVEMTRSRRRVECLCLMLAGIRDVREISWRPERLL